jgi:myosin heavy subunit
LGKIEFGDNADVLALIEGRSGLLSMLDDATNGVKPSDDVYTQQVIKAYDKHPRFVKPKFPNKPFFGVKHYAGDVTYTTTGFLEKNISSQPVEVIELMQNSNLNLLAELAIEFGGKVGGAGQSRKATVGSQFRKSLAQLVEKLNEAEAHFIRCIKPNMEKNPDQFDSPMVMNQLQLSGVMKLLRYGRWASLFE